MTRPFTFLTSLFLLCFFTTNAHSPLKNSRGKAQPVHSSYDSVFPLDELAICIRNG